jgi:hypothetical protein
MRKAPYCVAPQARVPSHVAKHLKFAPRGAQSESSVHAFEQALTTVMQPPSAIAPASTEHERPAAHSESELQAVPAGFKELLLQPRAAANGNKKRYGLKCVGLPPRLHLAGLACGRRFTLHLAW